MNPNFWSFCCWCIPCSRGVTSGIQCWKELGLKIMTKSLLKKAMSKMQWLKGKLSLSSLNKFVNLFATGAKLSNKDLTIVWIIIAKIQRQKVIQVGTFTLKDASSHLSWLWACSLLFSSHPLLQHFPSAPSLLSLSWTTQCLGVLGERKKKGRMFTAAGSFIYVRHTVITFISSLSPSHPLLQ